MGDFSLSNVQGEALWAAIIVAAAVAALVGLSIGFQGHVQF